MDMKSMPSFSCISDIGRQGQ